MKRNMSLWKMACISMMCMSTVLIVPKEVFAQSLEWLNYLNGLDYDFQSNSTRPGLLENPQQPPSSVSVEEEHLLAPEGVLSVTPSGSMSYTMQLEVPPGRAGVQPSLGLRYDSNQGNSYLGLGWRLTGLSRIERCTKSLAEQAEGSSTPRLNPSAKRVVSYDATDALCLDGASLFLENGEYRTERESFRRVKQVTSNTFEVRDNQGWLFEYGVVDEAGSCSVAQPESCDGLEVNALGIPYAWHIKRAHDPNGNVIEFHYEKTSNSDSPSTSSYQGGSTRSHKPIRIEYTKFVENGVEILSAKRSVHFDYEARQDLSNGFRYGVPFEMSERLRSVEMRYDGNTLHTYQLEYATESSPTNTVLYAQHGNNSRLIAIWKQTHGNGAIYDSAKTRFEWTNTYSSKARWDTTPDWIVPHSDSSLPFLLPGWMGAPVVLDLNGDMKTDIFHWSSLECKASIVKSSGSGFDDYHVIFVDENGQALATDPTNGESGFDCPAGLFELPHVATDYNQDGYDDILFLQYPVWEPNGLAYHPVVFINEGPQTGPKTIQFRQHY